MNRTSIANIIRGLLVGAALFVAIAPSFSGSNAGAVTGNAGPVTVSVTAKSASTVSVQVTAPPGVVTYEIRVHICKPNANIRTSYDFGYQGKQCTNAPIGTGDFEKVASYPDGVAQGDVDFNVSAGSTQWVNELGYPGDVTCGPDKTCDLVVRVQITDATVFFTAPLCIGDTCPPDSTPLGTGSIAVAGAAAAPPPAAATPDPGAQQPPAATPAAQPPAASPAPATTPAKAPARGASSSSSSSTRAAHPGATSDQAAGVISASGDAPSRGVRVFVAALAGALGGARIVSVMGRVRRRRAPAAT